jgi:hypothetical protein
VLHAAHLRIVGKPKQSKPTFVSIEGGHTEPQMIDRRARLDFDTVERGCTIQSIIARISKRNRDILSAWERSAYSDAAVIAALQEKGLSEAAAKKRLQRAVQALKIAALEKRPPSRSRFP